jgi:lipopolysaccharide transport system ATP-binding protein
MSSEVAVRIKQLDKIFPIYEKPQHRLLQMLSPKRWKHRWYRQFQALKRVDFEIRRGETFGIVGRNGSGKSTLLQIICGTLSPSHGEVQVNGRIAALLELGAGFNPDFTGRENVYLNGTVLGLTRDEIDARFDDIIAFADIGDFIDQPVKSYSSGMYVRLAFAVAINVTPDILVVDEALAVGDEAFQRKCFARIQQLRDAGATVLFVSHSAGIVTELCDRAVLLDQGELLTIGSPKHVISRYHKMLYATADRLADIRAQIRKEREGATSNTQEPELSAADKVDAELVRQEPHDEEAYFDPSLVSKSRLEYERNGASIVDAHLKTLSGEEVNVLRSGEQYIYSYQVQFQDTVALARFGMMIKSVSGIELGGAASALPGEGEQLIRSGNRMQVSFRFRCSLVPGVYFLNAGVMGRLHDGTESYLHRIVDCLMFRILPAPTSLATGIIDFQISPEVAPALIRQEQNA